MKKTLIAFILLPLLLSVLSSPALAQTSFDEDLGFGESLTGWYVRVSGMLVMQEDSSLSDNIGNIFNPGGGIIISNAEVTFDDSFGLSLAGGFDFDDSPFSVELEFTFRATDIDSYSVSGTISGTPTSASGAASGDVSTQSIMINGYYTIDFDISRFGMYAGAGIGLAKSEAELIVTDPAFGTILFPEEDDTTFAWQLMLGVTYQLNDQTQLYGGVRYFDAGNVEFTQFNGENASINLEIGIKFSF